MLSLSNVGNGTAAASYYEATDDYYTGDSSPSAWWGLAAEALGLAGPVETEIFAQLLDGRLPSGEQLHHAAAGRRGGTDATFSAPKSVSLQALVGGDRRLIEAQQRAVDRALAHAQTLAACRVTEAGQTATAATGNLLVARFEHQLSRACDPQLHTHCVMVNVTRRVDGQWRALNNEALYRHKMLLGTLYRAELAREAQLLGYEVRLTHTDGRFELAHITDLQVRAFSQRSAAIEAYLEKDGQPSKDAKAWDKKLAAVMTREKKSVVNRQLLSQEWETLSKMHGISYAVPDMQYRAAETRDGVGRVVGESRRTCNALLAEAVSHLSERQAVFDRSELLRHMLERGVGTVTFDEAQAILDKGERPENADEGAMLIRAGERYTTPATRRLEAEILAMEVQGRELLPPIHPPDKALLLVRLQGLTTEQQDAACSVLLCRHQVASIQGRAGVGKTTLLAKFTAAAKACGQEVQGLAPSASAARELASTGMPTQTIAAFAARLQAGRAELVPKTVLVLDEAGMASSKQMHMVLSAVIAAGARMVLVGDTAQLAAVEAGKPFAQLQANGMATALVSQIQRQKNPRLRQAVELAVSGKIASAVELLDKEIPQIVAAEERYMRIAQDYAALTPPERAQTRVIAGTRRARGAINLAIRAQLGLPESTNFTLLARKDLTESQRRSTLSYEPGDVVQAEINYPSLGLKRGECARVVSRVDHRVALERPDGTLVAWQPTVATRLGVFVPQVLPLAEGDLMRVTANDRERGLINGDLACVLKVRPERGVLLRRPDGQEVWLDIDRPMNLDYGYCSTVHAAQGQTCDRVLVEADANSLTANRSSFYVAVSRARHTALIYTDDAEMLPHAMGRELLRQAALELIPEIEHIAL